MEFLRREFERQKSYRKEDFKPFCNGYIAGVAAGVQGVMLASPDLIYMTRLVEDALNAAYNDGAAMMSDLPSPGSAKRHMADAQETKEILLLEIRKLIKQT